MKMQTPPRWLMRPSPCCVLRLHDGGTADKKSKKRKEEYHVNHSQRNLKKLIRAKEDSIADEELFLSAAYQKYQTSLARAVTGRYRYGLQVLLDWDISEQAGVAYTDNYKVHLNAANPITQSFPTRFLRSRA